MRRSLSGSEFATVLLAMCGWAQMAVGANPPLKAGDIAPEFCCLDEAGDIWESRDHVGRHILVIYFYPSDFSFCCTRQAAKYRDWQPELERLGAKVVGISGDSVESHRVFKAENGLQFSLLSDSVGGIAEQFDVPIRTAGKSSVQVPAQPAKRAVTLERCTLIIGKDGRILYRETSVSPIHDAGEVARFIEALNRANGSAPVPRNP